MSVSCKVPGCIATISPAFLMCRRHWRMVPRHIARSVSVNWDDMRTNTDPAERRLALTAYESARKAAIDAVTAQLAHQWPFDGLSPSTGSGEGHRR